MKSEARVVVIGGGVAGCSLLYHLTRLGWTDVLLIEMDELTSGSTWHAAGLCTQFNSSYNLMKLLRYSLDLYESLEAETGQAVDLHRCGSLRLAGSQERLDEYAHRKGIADTLDIPFEIVSTERAVELFPSSIRRRHRRRPRRRMATSTRRGSRTHSRKGAIARGGEILRHTDVTAIERDGGHWRLETSRGEIRAEIVVNAAGQWARQVGKLVGVELPIVPLEHHYLITEVMDEVGALPGELPVLRDTDSSFYVREEAGALIVGPFERYTKPWAIDGIPEGFHSRLLPADLDRLEECARRRRAARSCVRERGHQVGGQRARRLHSGRALSDGTRSGP